MGIIDTIESKWNVVLTNYAKRMLEGPYSKLFETKIGQKIKGLEKSQKLSLEAGLYVISAFIDDKLPQGSKLRESISEIIRDAFPEIGKRIINGDSGAAHSLTGEIAKDIKGKLDPKVEEERLLADLLNKFSDRSVVGIASLVMGASEKERPKILRSLLTLSNEQAGNFFRFSEKDQRVLLSAMGYGNFEQNQERWFSSFNREVGETISWATNLIDGLSAKIKEQRKKGR